jgi:large subunit ribosomal protein L19
MMELIERIGKSRLKVNNPENFRAGDSIEVSVKIKEGEKERTQAFRGTVIKIQGRGVSRTFTVRKISDGVGVERTFPFASPSVERVKVIARGEVRRSKLYYLRDLKGKKARITFNLVAEDDKVNDAYKSSVAAAVVAAAAAAAAAPAKGAKPGAKKPVKK